MAIVGTAYILELRKIGRLGSIVDERMDRLVAVTRDVQVSLSLRVQPVSYTHLISGIRERVARICSLAVDNDSFDMPRLE